MMNVDRTIILLSALFFSIILIGCNSSVSQKELSDEVYDRLAISNKDKLSAASKRAIERHYDQGPEWYCEFKVHDLRGDFKYEEGVTRRDPSALITVNGTYYVYYTRSTGKTYGFGTGDPEKKVFPWDKAEIWYATSKD
ncbi:MAG: glycoside hydrolase family 117 protein, partial [Planctomycetota bacterium]